MYLVLTFIYQNIFQNVCQGQKHISSLTVAYIYDSLFIYFYSSVLHVHMLLTTNNVFLKYVNAFSWIELYGRQNIFFKYIFLNDIFYIYFQNMQKQK